MRVRHVLLADKSFSYRRCAAAFAATLALGLTGTTLFTAMSTAGAEHPQTPPTLVLSEPHVVVIKSMRRLHLFDGNGLVRSYPIDLGSEPLGTKLRRGDERTPEGRFRVVLKRKNSRYHRFLGIDYPDVDAVERGLAQGVISEGEAAGILRAISVGGAPNWRTELGGGIGIHGARRGFDWTGGCISLADEHVNELYGVLRIGDRIEILP